MGPSLPRLPGLVLGTGLAVIATLVPPAAAQAPVAELTRVEGEVAVIDGSGREVEPRQVGDRVRHGAIAGGGTVRTGSGGAAVLSFEDGSEVRLGEATEITLRVVDLSQLVATGRQSKPVARRLWLAGGEIEGRIIANPDVATELKSAGGIATLDSGVLALSAAEGGGRVRCTGGEATFKHAAAGLTMQLASGFAIELERRAQDRWRLTVDDANPGPLPIRLANGQRLAAVPGTRMTARLDGFAVELRVDRGRAIPESGG